MGEYLMAYKFEILTLIKNVCDNPVNFSLSKEEKNMRNFSLSFRILDKKRNF